MEAMSRGRGHGAVARNVSGLVCPSVVGGVEEAMPPWAGDTAVWGSVLSA